VPGAYEPERKRNPFVRSAAGGRVLSALQRPFFELLPPRGFGVLTTTGRRTGKPRLRCVRAIRRGDRAFLVSIGGDTAAWVKNLQAQPEVMLRIRGGRFDGIAHEPRNERERDEALRAYCETVNPFDLAECAMHRRGLPSQAKVRELHRRWFSLGLPLVIDLGLERGLDP
jgi:deazaflavin-dependent oxidoreductase (nitroreductase family)